MDRVPNEDRVDKIPEFKSVNLAARDSNGLTTIVTWYLNEEEQKAVKRMIGAMLDREPAVDCLYPSETLIEVRELLHRKGIRLEG